MTSSYSTQLTSDELDQWWGLYRRYAEFYHVALIKNGVQTKLSWLIDAGHFCSGLMAEQQGQFAGLTKYRCMPSQLPGQMIRFYDDLFVASDRLSDGLATLIKAVQAKA